VEGPGTLRAGLQEFEKADYKVHYKVEDDMENTENIEELDYVTKQLRITRPRFRIAQHAAHVRPSLLSDTLSCGGKFRPLDGNRVGAQ
jgi:hypothetical protein